MDKRDLCPVSLITSDITSQVTMIHSYNTQQTHESVYEHAVTGKKLPSFGIEWCVTDKI